MRATVREEEIVGDRTSRDANDPRDQLRAMNQRARQEMEDDEATQTGGQERPQHAAPDAEADVTRATRDQDDSGALRVPSGGDVGGGSAQREAGAPMPPPSAKRRE